MRSFASSATAAFVEVGVDDDVDDVVVVVVVVSVGVVVGGTSSC